MERVFIVGAKRTPIGNFNGSLKTLSAPELAAVAIKGALQQAQITPDSVDEVILGNVVGAGQGMGPGRQAAIYANIPHEIPAYSLNMVCGSGMKAAMNASSSIKSGDATVVVAAGAESMSQIPFCVPSKARTGVKMGSIVMEDLLIKDGLTDAFHNYHMGITAENVVEQYEITREQQDSFSVKSQQKAVAALNQNKFASEIIPVEVKLRNTTEFFSVDEYPKSDATLNRLSSLRPAFKRNGGSVTAGNSSGINDGASALVIASESTVDKYALEPLAEIVSYAQAGVAPEVMGLGPVPAMLKALKYSEMDINSIGLFELNEAFAGQALGVIRQIVDETGIDYDEMCTRTNVNGGAISLGHPLGASGNRIIVSLLYEMRRRNTEYGMAALCIGGGMGTAIILKNI